MIENQDYELIPDSEKGEDWHIRILSGDYVETIIKFGTLVVGHDDLLHFDFEVISSPIDDLSKTDPELIETVQSILGSILESAISTDEL